MLSKLFFKKSINSYTWDYHNKRVALIVSLLVLCSGCALLGYFVTHQARIRAQTFAGELNQAVVALKQVDQYPADAVLQAQQHLLAARKTLETFRPVGNLVTGPANGLIDVPGIRQVSACWIFADEASLGFQELLNVAWLSAVSINEGDVTGLAPVMPQLQPHLQAAENHLRRAQAVRPLLDTTWFPNNLATQAETSLARWDLMVPFWAETLPQVNQLIGALPVVLGSRRPMTYLVIVQSSDNLKATGGFLTGAGTIRFEQSRITNITIHDVTETEFAAKWTPRQGYTTPRIVPPDPIRRYMGLGHWVLRDGNWWADFPATARQVAHFWQLVDETPVDGVIGITDQGIVTLLEAVGPISISGGQSLNAGNMRAIASQRIFGVATPEGNSQSAFFQEVAIKLAASIQQLPLGGRLALVRHLQTAARRHDIMIASFDPALAPVFHKLGVDGAIRGQQDDYFYLVEDNLADSKLNSFVMQSLNYQVQLDPDSRPLQARLVVDKINAYTPGTELVGFPKEGYNTGGRWDAQTQRWDKWEGYYGGYLRLFPPPESHLLEATGFDDKIDVGTESDRIVFGGYVGLWAGSQRQLQFQWRPGGRPSVPGQYRLLVQRQPGTLDYPLTVQVYLPHGYQATAITPPPTTVTEQAVIWQASLNQDRNFSLRLTQ